MNKLKWIQIFPKIKWIHYLESQYNYLYQDEKMF